MKKLLILILFLTAFKAYSQHNYDLRGFDTVKIKNLIVTGSGGAVRDTFTVNPTLYAGLGKYNPGAVAPWKGLTATQAMLDAIYIVIHPNYYLPTATINVASGNAGGDYDYGATISATFGYGYTQNNAGLATGVTYKQGGTTVSSVSIASLTTATSYNAIVAYNAGTCVLNNVGATDCIVGGGNAPSAPVASGGVTTSNNVTYTPRPRMFVGTCVGTSPTSGEIIAAAGGTSFLTTSHAYAMSVNASGSNLHVFIASDTANGLITQAHDAANNDVFAAYSNNTSVSLTYLGIPRTYQVLTSINTYSSFTVYTLFQ